MFGICYQMLEDMVNHLVSIQSVDELSMSENEFCLLRFGSFLSKHLYCNRSTVSSVVAKHWIEGWTQSKSRTMMSMVVMLGSMVRLSLVHGLDIWSHRLTERRVIGIGLSVDEIRNCLIALMYSFEEVPCARWGTRGGSGGHSLA